MLKSLLKTDKLLHNLINYIIVFTLSILTNYWIGLSAALAASLSKEFIYDKWLKKGQFEILDLISNLLGIAEATVIYFIYIFLI